MKQYLIAGLLCLAAASTQAQQQTAAHGYPIDPVPFTSVKITDSFWGQRLEASRTTTIPLAFSKCEESGRYDNFVKAAHPSDTIRVGGFSFDDTDVYKTIEGASYILQTYPDKKLEAYIDSVLLLVAGAQEPDGYLYTARTMNPKHPHDWAGSRRWEKVEELSHEFYNLGHMVEGAVAHYQATGKRNFLDIAIRYADCVCRAIGDGPDQLVRVPGHQIAEMALARLYLATGNRKYLDQAKFFLDKRGYTSRRDEYSQAHKPVVEQDEAVGHAVRATYMYSGMADVAALTGDSAYIHAIDRIWENIVDKKLYITGGIGATSDGEAFGKNYELPNMSAYCETCAAIGNIYLNYRLFLLHGESKYYDVLERTLYNGLISGVSLQGDGFFYPNPLESLGQHQRQAWFGCACCPSNICRFIPSLPGYVYATKADSLYVNLYVSNTSELKLNGKRVTVEQQTGYPWDGDIRVNIVRNRAGAFTLKLRIPGWAQNRPVPGDLYRYVDGQQPHYTLEVNGQPADYRLDKGYACISRRWKAGDRVTLRLDMEPRVVRANDPVEADRGRIAVERGPVVYCAEWPDNDCEVQSLLVNRQPRFQAELKPDMLGGIVMLTTDAQALAYDDSGRLTTRDVRLSLIPYYAWAHRGPGGMMVWLPQDVSAARPTPQPTVASRSRTTASYESKALKAISDSYVPADGNDRSIPYYNWYGRKGTTEWVTYEADRVSMLSSATVYWYDDAPWGDCRVPRAWRLYYKDKAGQWQPVKPLGDYPLAKGTACTVKFEPVSTQAVKLEVDLPDGYSAGLYEWEVK